MSSDPGTIVVGFDGPGACHDALVLGARLARPLGATLVAAFVYRADGLADVHDAEWEGWLRSIAERELAAARRLVPEAETVAIGAVSVAEGLHTLAVERDARLIVMGGTRRGPVGRVVLGTKAQRLLSGAPCPVVVSPHGWDAEIERVVVGYDGSEEARRAAAFAGELASALGVPAEVVSAVEPPPALAPEGLEMVRLRFEALTELRREGAAEAAASIRDGVEVTTHVERGHPAEVLLQRASHPGDLLVMGSRAYGPVNAVLLGSVAAEVMHTAICPVIVVPRHR